MKKVKNDGSIFELERKERLLRDAAPEMYEALQSAMRILRAIKGDTVAPYEGDALPLLDWILDGDKDGESIAVAALRKARGEE